MFVQGVFTGEECSEEKGMLVYGDSDADCDEVDSDVEYEVEDEFGDDLDDDMEKYELHSDCVLCHHMKKAAHIFWLIIMTRKQTVNSPTQNRLCIVWQGNLYMCTQHKSCRWL